MIKKNRKMINTLSTVIKHRGMELEHAVADVNRAKQVVEKAEEKLNKAEQYVHQFESGIREARANNNILSVDELIMTNNYLELIQSDYSSAKLEYENTSKVFDEAREQLTRKNQELEIVNRLKAKKEKQYGMALRNNDMRIMDELNVQKKGEK